MFASPSSWTSADSALSSFSVEEDETDLLCLVEGIQFWVIYGMDSMSLRLCCFKLGFVSFIFEPIIHLHGYTMIQLLGLFYSEQGGFPHRQLFAVIFCEITW